MVILPHNGLAIEHRQQFIAFYLAEIFAACKGGCCSETNREHEQKYAFYYHPLTNWRGAGLAAAFYDPAGAPVFIIARAAQGHLGNAVAVITAF